MQSAKGGLGQLLVKQKARIRDKELKLKELVNIKEKQSEMVNKVLEETYESRPEKVTIEQKL